MMSSVSETKQVKIICMEKIVQLCFSRAKDTHHISRLRTATFTNTGPNLKGMGEQSINVFYIHESTFIPIKLYYRGTGRS